MFNRNYFKAVCLLSAFFFVGCGKNDSKENSCKKCQETEIQKDNCKVDEVIVDKTDKENETLSDEVKNLTNDETENVNSDIKVEEDKKSHVENESAKQEENKKKDDKKDIEKSSKKKIKEKKETVKKDAKENLKQGSDLEIVQVRLDELKELTKSSSDGWLEKNAATNIIRSRVFGQNWKKLKQEEKDAFSKTWIKFLSSNIESFLPTIKDYSIKKVKSSNVGKKIKKFEIDMIHKQTNEVIKVEVISTNNLRIIDVIAQEVSILSILRTNVNDIINSKTNKIKKWNDFIKNSSTNKTK